MTPRARAFLAATLAIGAGYAAAPLTDIPPGGVAILRPDGGGAASWDGDRMRGARERLKDVLPGSFG